MEPATQRALRFQTDIVADLRHILRPCVAIAVLCAIAACEMPQQSGSTDTGGQGGANQTVAKPTSKESAELRSYFAQVQSAQLSQGLLRQDGGGPDTPFTPDMLARNFEQIVFYNEYANALQGRGGESSLRRWAAPIRVGTDFGDAVPPSQRAKDDKATKDYARRLGRITGHPVSTLGRPNFIVVFAGEDDRDTALDAAADRIPGITRASLDPLRTLSRDTYCVVAAYASGRDPNTYTAAVALIRAENPDILRLSCIHEEMAQALGLANDSPDARPSIFNDDDEFALLTDHDELLLKMLYDPRLEIGISLDEAAPVTRLIARELMTGSL